MRPARHVLIASVLLAEVACLGSSGGKNGGNGGSGSTFTLPPLKAPVTALAPQAPQPPPASQYPLSEADAIAYVQAGATVAGIPATGNEITISPIPVLTYVNKEEYATVCGPEYDPLTGDTINKCRYKWVVKPVQTIVTTYRVSGAGPQPNEFNDVYAAFEFAAGLNVTRWRRLP